MIVRVLGEGQFEVDDDQVDALNTIDERLVAAIDADDQAAFADALSALIDQVRNGGTAVPLDSLTASDLVLPQPDASLAEVRALLADDGLIPG